MVGVIVLRLLIERSLALHRKHIVRDRERHILLAHAWKLEAQNEVILRLVHVHDRHPDPALRARGDGPRTSEEAVEQPIHLAPDLGERVPLLHRSRKGTPTSDPHTQLLLPRLPSLLT